MQRGVSLNELEQGARAGGFDTKGSGFSKKDDKVNKIFWIVAGLVGLVIVGGALYRLIRMRRQVSHFCFQPPRHVGGGVGDQNVRAGAAHRQQAFQRDRALVNPAVGAGRLHHRVFGAHRVGRGRVAELGLSRDTGCPGKPARA